MLKSISEHMREKTVTGAVTDTWVCKQQEKKQDWRLMVLLSSVFALPKVSF